MPSIPTYCGEEVGTADSPSRGRGDRYVALCEEGLQFLLGVSEHHALSRHQLRPLCGVDQPYRLGDALRGGRGCGDVAAVDVSLS